MVRYARENLYIVKTLKEFQFIDEEGKDQGSNGECHLLQRLSLAEKKRKREREEIFDPLCSCFVRFG